MAKVSLRMYNREIEGLIEHGQRLDEAIVHCRHILKTFPKHLETYRLLGKAYLEAKRYDQAVDIFQRVLVVAPDDFVSHVGMSIIADDKGRLDDAIWHMERAFEVQPSNAAIQGELQRLFGRRDGVEPPKIRLTRGALAHMYVQGELYTQAISEIRAVLGNDPKRTDMQTLLAIAYFRNGQKPEATDICNDLLTRFPYCLDANRLMVEILPGTQRADSIQEYRQRVIELDPYAAFAPESIFHSENAADSAVSLERLEYTGQPAEAGAALGIGLESDSTAIGRSSEQPRWLRDASASEAPTIFEVGNVRAPASKSADEIPDFLRQSGWGESTGAAQETPSSFGQEAESSAAIEGDLPDWVKALAPTDEEKPVAPSTWPPAEASPQSEETPDWLHNLGSETFPVGSQSTPEETGVLPAEGSRSIAGHFPEDHPEDARGFIPTTPESSLPGSDAEETPDWLKNLGGRELDEPAAPSKASTDADWLGELRAEQASASQSETPATESPDWLKDFNNDLETPIQKTEAAEPKQTSQPAADSLAEPASGLGSLGTTPQEQDDALAWLEGLAAKHGAKSEELVTDPDVRTEVAPDWVDKAKEIGVEPSEPAGRPATSDDKTDIWLRNLTSRAETLAPKNEAPEPFDLRSSLSDRGIFAGMDAEGEKGETPIMDERDTPDWFSDLGPKPAQRPEIDNAPDWLRGMSAEPSGAESADTPEASPPMSESEGDLPAEGPRSTAEQSQGGRSDAIGDLPAWLASLDKEEPITTPLSKASDDLRNKDTGALPAWLQAEAEPEPQVTKQEAQELRADWRPVDESKQPYEERPVAEAQAESVEAAPSEKPAPGPAQKVAAPSSVAPRPRPAGIPSRPVAASLGGAQSELGRGNIAAALDIYGRLIRKGKSLEDIIRDLRDALYRYPVEVPIWQALGDAYMRANRLQEALDAYTKAEELLR